jgi:hypothetical protein
MDGSTPLGRPEHSTTAIPDGSGVTVPAADSERGLPLARIRCARAVFDWSSALGRPIRNTMTYSMRTSQLGRL